MAALAAAAAVLGSVAMTGTANAAAGDLPFPGVTLRMTPANGSSGTVFSMDFTSTSTGLPVASFCPGDNPGGWFWTAFIVPAGFDIGALTFGASGSPLVPAGQNAAQFRPLATPTGTFLRGQAPGLAEPAGSPAAGQGLITSPAGLWLGNVPLPAGGYQVGVACYDSNSTVAQGGLNLTGRFYSTPITVTSNAVVPVSNPQGYTYAFGAVPAAPALTTSSYNAGTSTSTVNFTSTASVPATTGFTATLVPVGASAPIAPIAVPAGATSFQIPGVALGSSYTVTLVATNATGSSAASNSVTVAGASSSASPVVTAPDAFAGNAVTVTWTAPATPVTPAPVSYNVVITGGSPAITPQTFAGVTGLSQVVPAGLAIGGYTATVTPNYAAGSGVTGTAGSDGFGITPNSLILQEITVTRPPGALILTQRCGVFGPLDSFTGVDAFPGFPVRRSDGLQIGILPALLASADQIGTSPDINLVTPGVQVDPEFANYPEPTPPTYPTECGLSMGSARFVTSGNLAGQFYTASGRLNQVTVLDTRDTDTGWIARGDIEDNFTGTTGNTFSGDYLGWIPQVTDTSDPVGGSTYDQLVTAGGAILPGTVNGLRGDPILGESPVNRGLGIATMDARMQLLIPASADAANYSATLSLTVVPRA